MRLLLSCLFFTTGLLALRAAPEAAAVSRADPALVATIADLDARLFEAFNAADLEATKGFFAAELEFYHDKDGVSDYAQTIASFDRLYHRAIRPQRTLVPGSMEVYPIKDYGAVQFGLHRFCVIENGEEHCSVYKFVLTWRLRDDRWQLTRIISVGH